VLIVDGTLVPSRDHAVAEQSKNYRYATTLCAEAHPGAVGATGLAARLCGTDRTCGGVPGRAGSSRAHRTAGRQRTSSCTMEHGPRGQWRRLVKGDLWIRFRKNC
jgi:hypothetical protein